MLSKSILTMCFTGILVGGVLVGCGSDDQTSSAPSTNAVVDSVEKTEKSAMQSETMEKVTEAASDMKEQVKETAGEMTDQAMNKVEQTKQVVAEQVEKNKDKMEAALGEAKDSYGEK